MSLNPITYTEKVVKNFLRYQLTAYPFADPDLYEQMKKLLSLEHERDTPLMKGPYLSLSRSFTSGGTVKDLIKAKVFHPFIANIVPFPDLYGHQEKAIRAIAKGHPTLISTGTGSGKSECFLYPIISHCLKLRDEKAPPGIAAVIVYPMNALAEDQLGRIRELLAGTGISFGMYVGKTPSDKAGVTGYRLPAGSSREDYQARLRQMQDEKRGVAVHPPEERCSRLEMRTEGGQPRILLTNVKQLELLLTRQADVGLFDGARLDYLVFDEAHTFSGAAGAETACLIRRLRAFCGKDPNDTRCVATSATIADPKDPSTARAFASRFFGVPESRVQVVGEEYEPEVWSATRSVPGPLPGKPLDHLKAVLSAVDAAEGAGEKAAAAFKKMTGQEIRPACWEEDLHSRLSENELVYELAEILQSPLALADVVQELKKKVNRLVPEEEILAWLALGAVSRRKDKPLLRRVIHAFVRGVGGGTVSFPETQKRPLLQLSVEE